MSLFFYVTQLHNVSTMNNIKYINIEKFFFLIILYEICIPEFASIYSEKFPSMK